MSKDSWSTSACRQASLDKLDKKKGSSFGQAKRQAAMDTFSQPLSEVSYHLGAVGDRREADEFVDSDVEKELNDDGEAPQREDGEEFEEADDGDSDDSYVGPTDPEVQCK